MSVAPRLTDVRRLLSSRSFLATPSSFRTVPTPHFLMQPHRAFASWYSKMQDFVHKRKEVGEDLVGNKYYLQEDGAHEARRIVQYANDIPDPSSIEMLWYQWLRYGRDAPPTKEVLWSAHRPGNCRCHISHCFYMYVCTAETLYMVCRFYCPRRCFPVCAFTT